MNPEANLRKCIRDCRCDGWRMTLDGSEMELTGPPVWLGARLHATAIERFDCGNRTTHHLTIDADHRAEVGTMPTVTRPDGTTVDWSESAISSTSDHPKVVT